MEVLTPFSTWLPASSRSASHSTELASLLDEPGKLSVSKKGVSLYPLLAGVSQVVAQAFKAGVWTMVEVVHTGFLGRAIRRARQGGRFPTVEWPR